MKSGITLATLCALLFVCSVHASVAATSAARPINQFAEITAAECDFDFRPGREFLFPTADRVLQPYGFVLWKTEASLAAEPLSYARYQGRRGKLSGSSTIRYGVRWYEGVLDDCSPVFAEDVSEHAEYDGLDHLAFYGKIVFKDNYAAAQSLIGHDVIVIGKGLEPRQRLYTDSRARNYDLRDGEALKVTGIDMHRYAHAKGVGPFFLQVMNARKEIGLIKFNPEYLQVPHGALPVYPKPRSREMARLAPLRSIQLGNRPILAEMNYVLTLSRFETEPEGIAAVRELEDAGFSARLLPQATEAGKVSYKLQIVGLQTAAVAQSLATILGRRFGWTAQMDKSYR